MLQTMNIHETEMIAVNGVELEVYSAGQGKPIMLCHGWPEHAFSWRHQVQPLVDAGYHVIVPNQRGYGRSSTPASVEAYDATQLTGDLVGLLDHFGYQQACFVGHDWGAINVWNLVQLHSNRVSALANMSVPFLTRGPVEWVTLWEQALGGDFYIVHFNRQPGVAEQAFETHCEQFLRNLYRTDQWLEEPVDLGPGMAMINIAERESMPGKLIMSEEELRVFVDGFNTSGFTAPLNWYRNFTRNWDLLADCSPVVEVPVLMLYGEYDMVPPHPNLEAHAPELETHTLPCGHWIQQEQPEQTNALLLDWLSRHYPA